MPNKEILLPKLITVLKEKYTFKDLLRDSLSGIVVGIIALPLSIAFAIASGVKPEQGLYTAIIGGFIISLLSGSRVQIGGPTGAFIVIVYHIIEKYGYENLATATLMAGVILVIMGLARLGKLIEYIPYPVTIGFTSGIAVIIFTSQLRDFLGLNLRELPSEFIEKIYTIFTHLSLFNPWALGLGVLSIAIITQTSRITQRIPGSIIAIILTTILVSYFHLPVEIIKMRFGDIPNHLPAMHIPVLDLSHMRELIMPAITIAMLAGIESLLSAVVADGMTGFRHRSNMELIAQGAANIGVVFFGGIPATGALARTATNIKNGGRSPIAGLVHALTLLLILLLFGKWASLIPIPALAAILIVVAYHMSEWRIFLKLFRSPKSDIAVLLTTFLLTIFVDLTVAIQVGFVLAAILFMKRMVGLAEVESVTDTLISDEEDEEKGAGASSPKSPKGVEIFEINGPFFFGAASKFRSILNDLGKECKILILRMRHVPAMDATGLRALEDIIDKCRKDGIQVILSGVRSQPQRVIKNSGLEDKVGSGYIFSNFDEAMKKVRELLK